MDKWIKKFWHTYIIIYYAALFFIIMNKIMEVAVTGWGSFNFPPKKNKDSNINK